jgi:hypothetical protein
MPIVEYTPERFPDLREMVAKVPGVLNLAHQPFVDYYYGTREFSRLFLYYSEDGKIIGTLGRELVRFESASQQCILRIASNWYSLRRGVGGELYEHSARSCPEGTGLMFSGSQDTLAILHHRNWIFMPGVHGYFLNNPRPSYVGESWWKGAAKSALRHVEQKRIGSYANRIPRNICAAISVREENSYTADLLPNRTPFAFRLAPSIEYLSWRYNLSLSFIRYRLFRILAHEITVGYVIVSDSPEKIIVAQCDGEDGAQLACGILLSILEVGREDTEVRPVFLTSSHPQMQQIFEDFGFHRASGKDLPFAFRTRPPNVDVTCGTANWLVNFDWGDNGMRAPFHPSPR